MVREGQLAGEKPEEGEDED